MSGGLRYRGTLRVELATGQRIHLDGAVDGEPAVLTHAHTDHLFNPDRARTICSPLTWDLALARRGGSPDGGGPSTHESVKLFDSGHIAGSTAALIRDERDGTSYLYTGDLAVRDRCHLAGFEPPSADVLIIETTYGSPAYRFPPQAELRAEIIEWLDETRDRVAVLHGYVLGRAQKLQWLAREADRDRILVSPEIAVMNEVIEAHLDVEFGATVVTEEPTLRAGDAVVVPNGGVDGILRGCRVEAPVVQAGFSGWAVAPWFRNRGSLDAAFPLSDHCDFDELVQVVRAVDPDKVYTHHGFADRFARHLVEEVGYDATPLVRNQTTLDDFG